MRAVVGTVAWFVFHRVVLPTTRFLERTADGLLALTGWAW